MDIARFTEALEGFPLPESIVFVCRCPGSRGAVPGFGQWGLLRPTTRWEASQGDEPARERRPHRRHGAVVVLECLLFLGRGSSASTSLGTPATRGGVSVEPRRPCSSGARGLAGQGERALQPSTRGPAREHARARLDRWHSPTLPGHRVGRWLGILEATSAWLPPACKPAKTALPSTDGRRAVACRAIANAYSGAAYSVRLPAVLAHGG